MISGMPKARPMAATSAIGNDDQLRVGQRFGVIGAGAVVGGAAKASGSAGSTKRASMPWSFSVLANRFQVPP